MYFEVLAWYDWIILTVLVAFLIPSIYFAFKGDKTRDLNEYKGNSIDKRD